MTVRLKIALLVAAAGFGASLIFSGIILWQMLKQPGRIIDSELLSIAKRGVWIVDKGIRDGHALIFISGDNYWLKIYTKNKNQLLYQSKLARIINLPEPKVGSSVTISRTIPRTTIDLGQDDENEVSFRARKLIISRDGLDYIVSVARPVEVIIEGLWDISVSVLSGLLFSSLLLLAISYFVAGVILKPVRAITELAHDITERHLDRRIPVANEQDEFNALAKTLNKVFERLQNAFLGQKRLLSDTSHELKTPLTMMRLSLDELRSTDAEQPTRWLEIIGRMTEQTLRMERLVKNILDLSALEIMGEIHKEPVDLVMLLSSLQQDYQLLADAKNIRIESHFPLTIMVDGELEKLERVFSNLMDNAIKYNQDGGRVEILSKLSVDQVTIVISNTGAGLDEDEIPRVFDMFYRAEESRALRYGGSGLGLAIVKRIVQLHGGQVNLTSRTGEWTRVIVKLNIHRDVVTG
ncbi:MAG TPA: HAMP domain-containing histidine kinase [Gammaproteobacteria bacterium]|nr:HAMP domain-containing histidine kinase [Gammaproteobacteria bacterium]